jgi:hypothetical protein
MIKFLYTAEFCKEFATLSKKWRSLGTVEGVEGDFADLKKLLQDMPTQSSLVERINNLGQDILLPVYKVRSFYCHALKSSSKLRVIYLYDEHSQEVQFIQFIELFEKADQTSEDRRRIEKYAKGKRHIDDSELSEKTG